jgi:hypothetical protein
MPSWLALDPTAVAADDAARVTRFMFLFLLGLVSMPFAMHAAGSFTGPGREPQRERLC